MLIEYTTLNVKDKHTLFERVSLLTASHKGPKLCGPTNPAPLIRRSNVQGFVVGLHSLLLTITSTTNFITNENKPHYKYL